MERLLSLPPFAEQEAVRLLDGVGDPEREWWFHNRQARIGHLRVPVTSEEYELVPPGCAMADAGESGPVRPRSRPRGMKGRQA